MGTRIFLPGGRGRWVRRGGSIVLHGADGGGEPQGEVATPVAVTATPAGVIDARIDVFAQKALLRMAQSPDPAARADASAMLGAVKSGALAGIYKEDEQVPAMRARKLGSNWWTVIPRGEDAALILGAAPGEAPLIAFRDGARSQPARLDPALRKAWASFVTFTSAGARCRRSAGGGTMAEVGGPAGVVLANLFPRVLCQAAPPPTLRICIFHGYQGTRGDVSNLMVARTLGKHLARRFPSDQIDVICALHKNAFVKTLLDSPLPIRQIHYVGHGFMGGLYFGYKHPVALAERNGVKENFATIFKTMPATTKRILALNSDAGLMSGFFTDAFDPALLTKIRANLAPGAMMQIWGCFAGARQHTFDTSDRYWNLFNAAGAPVDGIALHIARALGIDVSAAIDVTETHGMNYWFRDEAGKFNGTDKRPARLPQWLWPSRKSVSWITWDSAGKGDTSSINFMGKARPASELRPGRPPGWFTGELPVNLAAGALQTPESCSARYVTLASP